MSDRQERIAVNDPRDVPQGLSDDELIEYWDTHKITEEFLTKAEDVPVEERPHPRDRTKPVSVRLDNHTLARLKRLAEIRGIGYQTMLKDFVKERLYEEELREGLVPAGHRSAETEAPTDPVSLALLWPGIANVWATRHSWRHLSAEAPVLKKRYEDSLSSLSTRSELWRLLATSPGSPYKGSLFEGADATSVTVARKMLEKNAVVMRQQVRRLAQSGRQRKAVGP